MKKEYDLSKGTRGKFYRPNIRLNLPVYLDADVAEFIQKFAKRKNVDPQTAVNKILRGNKEIIQAVEQLQSKRNSGKNQLMSKRIVRRGTPRLKDEGLRIGTVSRPSHGRIPKKRTSLA